MTDNNPECIIDRVHQLESAIREALSALGHVEDDDALRCVGILSRALKAPNPERSGPTADAASMPDVAGSADARS